MNICEYFTEHCVFSWHFVRLGLEFRVATYVAIVASLGTNIVSSQMFSVEVLVNQSKLKKNISVYLRL